MVLLPIFQCFTYYFLFPHFQMFSSNPKFAASDVLRNLPLEKRRRPTFFIATSAVWMAPQSLVSISQHCLYCRRHSINLLSPRSLINWTTWTLTFVCGGTLQLYTFAEPGQVLCSLIKRLVVCVCGVIRPTGSTKNTHVSSQTRISCAARHAPIHRSWQLVNCQGGLTGRAGVIASAF